MTEISERFDKLAGQMSGRIAAIPDDGWDDPTPCEEWTVKDLVDHVLDTPAIFFDLAGLDPIPPGPDRADDPHAAFEHNRAAVQAALVDLARAQKEFDGMMGRQSFEGAIDKFICADLVVHQWDLARATGQDETLDADEVAKVHRALLPMDEVMRGPGSFADKVDAPADADDQTKLLSFLGRQV